MEGYQESCGTGLVSISRSKVLGWKVMGTIVSLGPWRAAASQTSRSCARWTSGLMDGWGGGGGDGIMGNEHYWYPEVGLSASGLLRLAPQHS